MVHFIRLKMALADRVLVINADNIVQLDDGHARGGKATIVTMAGQQTFLVSETIEEIEALCMPLMAAFSEVISPDQVCAWENTLAQREAELALMRDLPLEPPKPRGRRR